MTALTLPTDARQLAAELKDRDLPGKRSMTAITRLRRERARRHIPGPHRADSRLDALRHQAAWRVTERYRREIARRGGEVMIEDQYGHEAWVQIADRPTSGRWQDHVGLTLMRARGWRAYGRDKPRLVSLSYLCGVEAGKPWAVRVPGTITTVREAVWWIEPVEVRKARQSRPVYRQGDVYAVFTRAPWDGAGADQLPENHTWDAGSRYLRHPDHRDLFLPTPVRFYRQKALEMGRSGRYGNGD
jgi:hypothetical protein